MTRLLEVAKTSAQIPAVSGQECATTEDSRATSRRSGIWTAYNAAKPLVRAGQIDGKRLNRALGVAQANPATNHLARYRTSLLDCRCPDHRLRGITCKGQIAVMLLEASR